MAVNIGPRIGIDGEDKYRKQIAEIIKDTKLLKSEYEKTASSLQKGTDYLKRNAEQHKFLSEKIEQQKKLIEVREDAIKKAIETQKRLTEEIKIATDAEGENSEKVKELKKAFDKNVESTKDWKVKLNEANTELNNMKEELNGLPNQIQLVGTEMKSAGDKIKDFGGKVGGMGRALAPLSATAAGALGGSVKSAIDFETAFTGVRKTVEESEEGYKALSDWIKEASTQMASSKSEIAGVMEVSGQLGVSGVRDLENFTKVMIMLGDTTELSSEEAAKNLARFANITGGSYEEVENLGSSIVALGNKFATNEAEITEMATRLAGAGTIAGLTQPEILALATAMSSVGIEAEAGGTAMTQTLNTIEKAVATNSDKVEIFARVSGMSAEQFAKTWQNKPIDAISAFIKGLGNLTEADEGTIQTLEDLGLSGIRQSDTLNRLSLANDILADSIDVSNKAWKDGTALQDEANEKYGTSEAKILQFKENLSNLGIDIGNKLLPHLNKFIDKLNDLVDAWDGLDESEKEGIIKAGLIVAASGPVLTATGKVAEGIGSITGLTGDAITGIGGLAKVFGIGAGGTGGLAGAASGAAGGMQAAGGAAAGIATPAAIAIGVVGLLAGAFLTAYKNDKEFAGEVKTSWEKIKTEVTETIAIIKPAWEKFSSIISPIFVSEMDSVSRKLDMFQQQAQGFIDVFGGLFSGDWKRVLKGAEEIFSSFVNRILDKFKATADGVKGVFEKLDIKLPDIKVPHFVVKDTNRWGLPSIGIEWYAKAMQDGMRLTSPTIFGAANGKLMAGGEAGNEWVIGERSLMGMIRGAVRSAYVPGGGNEVNIGGTTIIINAAEGQDVQEIADRVDEIIDARLQQAEAAWA